MNLFANTLLPVELDSRQKAEILKKHHFLEQANDEQILTLASYFQSFSIPAGKMIFHEGDIGQYLALIVEGEVELQKYNGIEDTRFLFRMGEGKILGEMSLIDHQPRSATVVTVTDTVILALSETVMSELEEKNPHLWGTLILKLAKILSERLRRTSGELVTRL